MEAGRGVCGCEVVAVEELERTTSRTAPAHPSRVARANVKFVRSILPAHLPASMLASKNAYTEWQDMMHALGKRFQAYTNRAGSY